MRFGDAHYEAVPERLSVSLSIHYDGKAGFISSRDPDGWLSKRLPSFGSGFRTKCHPVGSRRWCGSKEARAPTSEIGHACHGSSAGNLTEGGSDDRHHRSRRLPHRSRTPGSEFDATFGGSHKERGYPFVAAEALTQLAIR